MKYELVVTADQNDADYVTETSTISEENIEELKPIIAAIEAYKNTKGWCRTWPRGEVSSKKECPEVIYRDILTPEQIEFFDQFVPYGEHGVHSIESVVYYPLPEKVILFQS